MRAKTYTTGEAAKQIGVSRQTLQTWITRGQIDAPEPVGTDKASLRLWTKADIEKAKKFKGTLRRGRKPHEKTK